MFSFVFECNGGLHSDFHTRGTVKTITVSENMILLLRRLDSQYAIIINNNLFEYDAGNQHAIALDMKIRYHTI